MDRITFSTMQRSRDIQERAKSTKGCHECLGFAIVEEGPAKDS